MTESAQQLLVPTFFLMCLSLVVPALDPNSSSTTSSCDRERKVLTDDYGVVSSGNKEYPMDSHCEWLIKASDKRSYITLSFTKMDTECSYDHVFIYDGDSYSSPLLGSFSGNTTPPMITTTQGKMLILLYSDTNYVRNGFEATYVVTDCPLNCSNRGMCQNHRCICDTLWSGDACDISLCPMDCGLEQNRGVCDMNGSYPPRCNCRPGFSGMDCSLPDSNKSFGNTWHLVSSSGITPRASHTGTYVQHTDSYYVFGGFTFKEILGDTFVYSFKENRWTNITSNPSPKARHGHSAVGYHDNIIIFGGEMYNGTLSNELWFFNVSSLQWNLITPKSHIFPPPVTKHSMTLVDFYWLYVIGGSLSDGTFSSKMYRINIRDMNGWEMIDTNGGKESNHRLVGHSAVYHQQTKTIFVFGGITAEYSHVSKLSNHIYAFHIETKYWIQIKYERNSNTPLERAFHTAEIVGDYMIVYGGYTHKHVEEEICYDNEFHLYHLKCHKWIDFSSLRKDSEGLNNPIKQGVFSHSMGVRRGHTIVIFGGYSGLMRPHFLAYLLPQAILNEQLSLNFCSIHIHIESCLANLACGWCFETNTCLERMNHKSCSQFTADSCPGFCSALSDCPSCLIWGESLENVINDRQDLFPVMSCQWCVPDMKCHSADEITSCSSNASSSGPSSTSWWGSVGFDASTLEDCYIRDSPPGLVSVKYRHPVNFSQPDDVAYLHQASEDVIFRSEIQRYDINGMEENIVKFLGFLHPLNAKPLSKRISQLQLSICSAGSNAVLKLSNDSTSNSLEIVASHSPRPSFYCSDVHRARGVSLFSDTSEGHKYMFDFTVRIPAYLNETSVVQLKWTAFSVDFEVINHKHLELYKNGSCFKHSSCLSCLTDTLCGWCEGSQQCYPKSGYQVLCQKNGKIGFLVIHPDNCSVCSDYIYCEQCTQISSCEWIVEAAICVRRSRFRTSVQDPQFCPVPCPLRTSCISCLNDPGMCAWCEETQTCFLFSTYTSSYSYGRCRDWVDENRAGISVELCRNCSKHSQCSTCIKDLTCGWCSTSSYPGNGVCTDGDFSGPFSGFCSNHLKNTTISENLQWSYGQCPDLEECFWNLHECHENATCHNTPESYTCECNVGFDGDGRMCTRACSVKCLNGYCSNAPDYICVCDLGWTGEDCSISCGCNNHSTCNIAVGQCDQCQNWTEGTFCERCRPGSFGDATTSIGCQKCDCNGHGDSRYGYCNTTSGICFCLNNTVGPNCSKCKEGYYGNPKNNGICFEECHPRKVITNATEGRFGSPAMATDAQDCLWLITIHSVLDMQSLLGPMQSTGTYLQVKIHQDINIPCPHNHIYIYDGLPNFVASGHPNTLLGAFCGTNLTRPIIATAASGYLTIHFKRGASAHGFNASYTRLPRNFSTHCCDENSVFEGNCSACIKQPCPNNCSASVSQGQCVAPYGICVCNKTYSGDDCSTKLPLHALSWKILYDLKWDLPNNISLPVSRIGSSLLTYIDDDRAENLILFGGYSSAAGYLNDLFLYNTSSNLWIKIFTDYAPPARHFHGAAFLNKSMYIYGGLGERTVLGDFWFFSSERGWIQLPEITTSTGILTMAGSTLTAVNENRLVLFGGFSPSYGFFERVLEYDTQNRHWLIINCTGAQPIGLYGHSSVYHSTTESIYVFGGISYDVEHVAPCNYLYSFHYPSSEWFRLPPDNKVNKLQTRTLPRYFHTSVVSENYLIIMGGRGGTNTLEEASQPFAYVFSCNLWIPLTDEAIETMNKWPEPFIGASATVANGDFYFYGGMSGQLYKLSLPKDICLLFSASRVGCMQQTGCAFCSLTENGVNQTFCFAQDKHSQSKCYNPKEASKFLPSITCNEEWLEKRNCHQYTSCTDCVASWPSLKRARQVCQWCSNCRTGRCVPDGSSCEDDNDCNIPRKVVTHPDMCPMKVCGASDCENCADLKMCIWTRQVHRSSGFGLTLNKMPIYNWVCVMKEIQSAPSFPIESMPPLECPAGCIHYSECTSCLRSQGGEGGWHQCVWSEVLQSCMSPSFELLACEDGTCGLVVRGNESSCPLPCWEHFQASHCLAQANCGWCAFSGPKVDGRGLCMDGGIMGATGGICRENQVLLLGVPMPSQTLKWFQLSEGPPTWTYLAKPPENECENGHHNCDNAHEECVDTLEGFECHCKPGYKMKGKKCTPICKQGCVNGTCIQPDVCQCNFGFVGKNCSIMCKCNGHSNCPGPEDLENCLECKNNTFGKQCQKCKPLYVGNPINGGKCISCNEYCHTHSGLCFGSDLSNITASLMSNQSYIDDLVEKLVEGPIENAFCIDCKNNTQGRRCNECIPGYFKAGESLEDGCRPCECHGHGDTCNPLNGENCNCQNNTENDRQCTQKNIKNMLHMTPCWQLQCSKCKEYFLGSPANSHQCYRHMYLDKEYCFDPSTQGDCNRIPNPLLFGQTVFFAVQPRYMNVDIRIVVDITSGGVDFFLSAKEDAFIVDVEKPSGLHRIYIDEKYGIYEHDLSHYETASEFSVAMQRKKREEAENEAGVHLNSTESPPPQTLQPKIGDAQGLTTYIDVKKCEDFLHIRNLENRLIVTIPQEVHDLRTTRFYMILRGAKRETFGSLFFRQDQTRIDLFVFFSVFFSCFFLFLAACVVAWKIKQAFDVRRARRLHAAEMKHMASRPFGHVLTVIDDDDAEDTSDFFHCSPSNYRKKLKFIKAHGRDSPKLADDRLSLRPIAVEPLSDGYGAIATILVQLPGGARSLVRMTLASSLITSRSSHYHLGYGLRAAMRRRTSHVNV